MFAGQRRGLGFSMKDGDKVVAGGTVDVYAVSYTHLDVYKRQVQ